MKRTTIIATAALLAAAYPLAAQARGDDTAQTNAPSSSLATSGAMGSNSTSNSPMTTSTTSDGRILVWDSENAYWRDAYTSRPYYMKTREYTVYEPAYRYGYDLYQRYPNRRYDELSPVEIKQGWSKARSNSDLSWNEAEPAARDAYERLYSDHRTHVINDTGSNTAGNNMDTTSRHQD